MEVKKSPTKKHFEDNAKKFVIKVGSKTLHRKCECQYSQFLKEYYDFDTFDEVKKLGLEFKNCKNCFKIGMELDAPLSVKKANHHTSVLHKYDDTEKYYVYNRFTKILHRKDCQIHGLAELCEHKTLREVNNMFNSNTNFKYCKACHPENSIPNAPTEKELMYRKSNVAEKYNLYWLMRSFGFFFVIVALLFILPVILTYEPGYDDASVYIVIGCAVFEMAMFGLPCFLYALNIKKNFGEHFTESIKEEHKETKKIIYKISIVVLIASIIIGIVIGLIATSSSRRKDKYDDIWDKDPNSWTEDEEYVNDFFDWMDEND